MLLFGTIQASTDSKGSCNPLNSYRNLSGVESPGRKVLCFLPILAGRDREGNEQKFGGEGNQESVELLL